MELAVDLLLGAGLLSRGIAWWGNGYGGFSHAASVINAETYIDSHVNTIAGVPPGVQRRAISSEKCIKRERLSKEVSRAIFDDWIKALESNLKAPYGTRDIFAFITGQQEHTQGQWICSADVLRALRIVGEVPPLSIPDHQITPNSLGLILEARSFRRYTMAPIT
jgi:hypothetical protein